MTRVPVEVRRVARCSRKRLASARSGSPRVAPAHVGASLCTVLRSRWSAALRYRWRLGRDFTLHGPPADRASMTLLTRFSLLELCRACCHPRSCYTACRFRPRRVPRGSVLRRSRWRRLRSPAVPRSTVSSVSSTNQSSSSPRAISTRFPRSTIELHARFRRRFPRSGQCWRSARTRHAVRTSGVSAAASCFQARSAAR